MAQIYSSSFLYYPSVRTSFGFQLVSEKLDSSRFSPGLPSRSRTRHAVISHHLHFHHSAPSSSLLLFPSVCLFWCMCVCVNVCLFLFMFVYVGCFGRSGVDCFCLFGGQPTSVGDTHMNLGNFLSTRSWIFVFFSKPGIWMHLLLSERHCCKSACTSTVRNENASEIELFFSICCAVSAFSDHLLAYFMLPTTVNFPS